MNVFLISLVTILDEYLVRQRFDDIDELSSIQCWTTTDARRMAAWRAREMYLEEMGVFKQYSRSNNNKKSKKWRNKKKV